MMNWSLFITSMLRANALNRRPLSGERRSHCKRQFSFFRKASGIKQRFVMDKSGVWTQWLCDSERSDEEPSIQCEIAVAAVYRALDRAKRRQVMWMHYLYLFQHAALIQRWPLRFNRRSACSVGLLNMNVACSSATFEFKPV